MTVLKSVFAVVVMIVFAVFPWAAAPVYAEVAASHGFAIHGDLKYGPQFTHFDYVNPKAPKGGEVRLSVIGTFDSLNGFIMKGNQAAGVALLHSRLMEPSRDEPASQYCVVCESIEVPKDRGWVAFSLRPEARFSDGSGITADDVVFSFNILKTKGHPFYKQYYRDVLRVEKEGPRKVKFIFAPTGSRELPVIIGELPMLSKAYWSKHDFGRATLDVPVASGPYTVASVDAGRSITYKRVAGWWGEKVPAMTGRFNFNTLKYVYYRDETVALQAFGAGEYDVRWESSSKLWAMGYNFSALAKGQMKKEEIPDGSPVGMQGLVFNTRRPIFADRLVREALGYAFDFEWTNRALMYNAYSRTKSYFERSELAGKGLPAPEELAILGKYRGRIPDEVFTKSYEPPVTDGSGNPRDNLRKAVALLRRAGWAVDRASGKLTHQTMKDGSGRPLALEFEILLESPAFERVVLPFAENLKKLGVMARVRTVDDTQYINRIRTFDFDMIVGVAGGQVSPGNEQRALWNSGEADREGGVNYAGVKDPVVDELVDLVVAAQDRPSLVSRARALDRVLLYGHYLIPQWHNSSTRVAYWNKLARPVAVPKYGVDFYAWWIDTKKAGEFSR